mgnify:CR=1 FL=1
MKTRDRILQTSLALFNAEGEANVTTVDIANEMDISPGNLYYHFKGKEEIVGNLFNTFDHEFQQILDAPAAGSLNSEDAWFYLYVVFEHIFNYRFLYRNINDIMERYSGINRQFRRLLFHKLDAADAISKELIEKGIMVIPENQRIRLCENIALNLTFWLNYDQLRRQDMPNELLIHQAVFQIMSIVAPHLAEEFNGFYQECATTYEELAAHILQKARES